MSVQFQIEEKITRSEREKRNLMNEEVDLLRRCEKARDGIALLAEVQAREAADNRLNELHRRIDRLNRVRFL